MLVWAGFSFVYISHKKVPTSSQRHTFTKRKTVSGRRLVKKVRWHGKGLQDSILKRRISRTAPLYLATQLQSLRLILHMQDLILSLSVDSNHASIQGFRFLDLEPTSFINRHANEHFYKVVLFTLFVKY